MRTEEKRYEVHSRSRRRGKSSRILAPPPCSRKMLRATRFTRKQFSDGGTSEYQRPRVRVSLASITVGVATRRRRTVRQMRV